MSAATPHVDAERIPDVLKSLTCWVDWTWATRLDADGEEVRTKEPHNARKGLLASTTKPATWSTFTTALKAMESGRYHGIGFIFNPKANGLTGVDLDKCRDPMTGVIAAWAQAIIDEINSYTEVSPSKTGIHIIVAGALPVGRRKGAYATGAVEMYDTARFFTMTGDHLDGTPTTIEQRTEALAAVHAHIWPEPPPPQPPSQRSVASASEFVCLSDSELVAEAMAAKNGPKFIRLWNGDTSGYPSQSEAEFALINALMFWTRGDAAWIDRLVHQSGLWREKWDARRGDSTYGQQSIQNALATYHGSYYNPRHSVRDKPADRTSTGITKDGAQEEGQHEAAAQATSDAPPGGVRRVGDYEAGPNGLTWYKWVGKDGDQPIALANFTAQIVSEVLRDDGLEASLAFEIEATLRNRMDHFFVPAERFAGMAWVVENLGSGAIISAGMGLKDHARVAIQTLSPQASRRHVYTHTGWVMPRNGSGVPFFAHAGGVVHADAAGEPDTDAAAEAASAAAVTVDLGHELQAFSLPEPPAPHSEEERAAILASLGMLEVAPGHVTVPVLSAVYRAPMGSTDSSVHLAGPTGSFKSEVASLGQRHYGATMDRLHLPASWKSTANALEMLAFRAKDVLLTVDDFCPTGSAVDVARLHAAADSLFRGAGNGAGRGRLRADTTARPPKPPRGLILSTGEDTPRGHSLRARLCIVEIEPNDVDVRELTRCQRDAQSGLYALAMAGYIRWLAETYADWHGRMADDLVILREKAAETGSAHRRTPEVTANLALGLRSFLRYALARGVLTREEATNLYDRGWKALGDVARRQARAQDESEPTRRFLELVHAALSSGKAHVATTQGEKPGTDEESWGWWRKDTRYMSGAAEADTSPPPSTWTCQGDRLGWLDGTNLYVEPNVAYAVTQRLASSSGESLGIGVKTLGKRLKERHLLASTDEPRETITVRRRCEGGQKNVWHFDVSTISTYKPPDKTDTSSLQQSEAALRPGHMSGSAPDIAGNPTHDPTRPAAEFNGHGAFDVGFVGSIQGRDDAAVEVLHNGHNGALGVSGSVHAPDTKTRHIPLETRQPDNPTSPVNARSVDD
ncbi:MAG TPA: hypothetical protein VF120_16605, partial [Ktedonobacterales bacterium]